MRLPPPKTCIPELLGLADSVCVLSSLKIEFLIQYKNHLIIINYFEGITFKI